MAKMYKRSMSVFLILAMFLGLLPLPSVVPRAAAASNDPFATMYNSDALFMEKVTPLLEEQNRRVELEALRDGAPEIDQRSFRALEAGGFESREQKVELTAETALEMAKRGELSIVVESLDFTEAERIEQLYEDARVDRFIVKYKSQSNLSVLAASRMRGTSGELSGGVELIVLNERVNPKEFADSLRAANMEREIEYIQPDFTLEFAGFELSYEEVEPEDEEIEGSTLDEDEEITPEEEDEEESALEELEEEDEELEANEILVALIDTGVDVYHEALQGYLVDGWNFVDDTGDVFDSASPISASHGTHIAGIIAETGGENVQILPLQVFGSHGAYTSDIIAAIVYAEAQGARVVNMSFGSTSYNPALYETIENSGMLFVASVGNARSDLAECPIYPAAFGLPNIISVASTNADGGFSYYSNYSAEMIDIAAQGRDVYSALPGNEYGLQSGTSMSAAYVTGIAAAVLSAEDMTADDLKDRLLTSADRLSNLQNKVVDGRRVNLNNALADVSGSYLSLNPEDDFDVHEYQPTGSELWQLYSSSGDVVKVAAGYSHTLVLKSNGSVWAWGSNEFGECGSGTTSYAESLVQVIGLSNITAISANGTTAGGNMVGGSEYSLAVKSDGTVWAWGNNYSGQLGDGTTTDRPSPVQVIGLSSVKDISAGLNHSLAVKNDGTVWGWGGNSVGELGDNTNLRQMIPVQAIGLSGMTAVSAGYAHSLAVKNDGTVWTWGYNRYGELGDGTTINRSIPAQVTSLSGITAISAGFSHSLARKSDGTVWAWGFNQSGQLGDGTLKDRTLPVQATGLSGVTDISAGFYFSMGLRNDSTVWVWGQNSYGQFGDGTTTMQSSTPAQVQNFNGVTEISAGGFHCVVIKNDNTVWAWGWNSCGQLGDGYSTTHKSTPVQTTSLSGVAAISSGKTYGHTLVLRNDLTVWAWGHNSYGQLGDGSTTSRYSPAQVTGLSDVTAISAGGSHILALKSDGTVWAWGYNSNGQLGDGTTAQKTTPVQITGLSGVTAISAGGSHSLALKNDGTVWAWGYNSNGQLGDGTTAQKTTPVQVTGLSGVTAISAGGSHSLALKNDGTVWAWGQNNTGQLGDGSTTTRTTPVQVTGLSGVTAISAGESYNLARKTDGTAWAWGYNYYGQLGDGSKTQKTTPVQVTGLSGVTTVSAGNSHSLALKNDGTVWAWGQNFAGQLGDGSNINRTTAVQVSGLTGAVFVAAGRDHSLALKSDGTVWGWGYNSSYQFGLPFTGLYTTPIQSQTSLPTTNPSNSNLVLTISQGSEYLVTLTADNITSFSGRTITVTYDPAKLQLLNTAEQVYGTYTTTGAIPGTGITVTSLSSGSISLTFNKSIPQGKAWSGAITVFKFKALAAGTTTVSVS